MQATKMITTLAAAASMVLLLASQAAAARVYKSEPRPATLDEVRLIGLDANMCMLGIRKEMSNEGFLVTDNLRVPDAVLEVKLHSNGSLHDHSEVENLHYSAVLVNANDQVLFATGGYESARNFEEVCEDIGDEIADELHDKMV